MRSDNDYALQYLSVYIHDIDYNVHSERRGKIVNRLKPVIPAELAEVIRQTDPYVPSFQSLRK